MAQLKSIEKCLDSSQPEQHLEELDALCDEYLKTHSSISAQSSTRVHEMLLRVWRQDQNADSEADKADKTDKADNLDNGDSTENAESDEKSDLEADFQEEKRKIARPRRKATILHILNRLAGCLIVPEQLNFWFNELSVYAVDSSGNHMDIVDLSQQFIKSVLTESVQYCDSLNTSRIHAFSSMYARQILTLYVSSKLPAKSQGEVTDERVRIVRQNCRMLFAQFARKETDLAFTMLNEYFVYAKYRLDILGFVVEYLSESQNSKLFKLYSTPFFNSLLQCLERDYSRPCVQLALTSLSMIIAHICDKLANVSLLCRIYAIFGRACSWQTVMPSLQSELHDHCDDWDLVKEEDVQYEETIDVVPLYMFLYALFPINTLQFCKHCDEYLNKHLYTKNFDDFWSRFMVTKKTTDIVQRFTLDPLLLTLNEETELSKCVQRFRELGSPLEISSIANSRYIHESALAKAEDLDKEIEERRKVFETSATTTAAHWYRELLLMRNELAFANFTITMSEHRALCWQKCASNYTVLSSQNEELTRRNKLLQKRISGLEEETQKATRSARTIMRERSAYESKLVNKTKETKELNAETRNKVIQLEKEKQMLETAEMQARLRTVEEQDKLAAAEMELKAVESGIIKTSDGVTILPVTKTTIDEDIEAEKLKSKQLEDLVEKMKYKTELLMKDHAVTVSFLETKVKETQNELAKQIRTQLHTAKTQDSKESTERKQIELLTQTRERNEALATKCAQLERELRARRIYEEERLNELQQALTSTKFFGPQDPVLENKFRGRGGAQGVPRRAN